ncbi:MAG: hypothetical protein ACREOO_14985 [bacterium]
MATTVVQRPLNGDRLFFSGMALLILGSVVVGFAPTFYMAPLFTGRPASPEQFFYVKGVVFSAWFLLMPIQCWLITSQRVILHRTLGIAGASIAVLLVISGIWRVDRRRPASPGHAVGRWGAHPVFSAMTLDRHISGLAARSLNGGRLGLLMR